MVLWVAIVLGVMIAPGCAKGDPVETARVKKDATDLIVDGRLTEALDQLHQVSRSAKSDSEVHFLIGLAEYNRKNYQKALKAYRQALKLDPNRADAHNNMGNTFRDMGDTEGAARAYRQAMTVNPNLAHPHLNLYLLLRDQGAISEAIRVIEHASAVLPDNLSVQLSLASAYDLSGDPIKASQTYESVKTKFPSVNISDMVEKPKRLP